MSGETTACHLGGSLCSHKGRVEAVAVPWGCAGTNQPTRGCSGTGGNRTLPRDAPWPFSKLLTLDGRKKPTSVEGDVVSVLNVQPCEEPLRWVVCGHSVDAPALQPSHRTFPHICRDLFQLLLQLPGQWSSPSSSLCWLVFY